MIFSICLDSSKADGTTNGSSKSIFLLFWGAMKPKPAFFTLSTVCDEESLSPNLNLDAPVTCFQFALQNMIVHSPTRTRRLELTSMVHWSMTSILMTVYCYVMYYRYSVPRHYLQTVIPEREDRSLTASMFTSNNNWEDFL